MLKKSDNNIYIFRYHLLIIEAFMILVFLCGCGSRAEDISKIDYSDTDNWAYYSIGEEKYADLFLIAPTVDTKNEYNMSIKDNECRSSFIGALNMERGIYEESTRMFAPYYRQGAMKIYELGEEEREEYLQIAYKDISDAFSYYLENENKGRPIILAGFSQGADMCYRLLEEYFDDEELSERLICVYAIGWPCTGDMCDRYPQIKPSTSEDDLGCVISFDCESEDVKSTFIHPEGIRAFSINPLNWKADSTPASSDENSGACFTDYNADIVLEIPDLCGCYIDESRGVLKVTDIDKADYPAGLTILPEGSYHIYDYMFFYRDLQNNVNTRIKAYKESR